MRCGLVLFLIIGGLGGCQKADGWDSTNPVHCMTVFGLASAGAAAQSNQAAVTDMNARQMRMVRANGGVPWIEQITPETQRLAAEIERANDDAALSTLLEECAARNPSEP
jgi:hypothetical protein